jgi:hypothetical protein
VQLARGAGDHARLVRPALVRHDDAGEVGILPPRQGLKLEKLSSRSLIVNATTHRVHGHALGRGSRA